MNGHILDRRRLAEQTGKGFRDKDEHGSQGQAEPKAETGDYPPRFQQPVKVPGINLNININGEKVTTDADVPRNGSGPAGDRR